MATKPLTIRWGADISDVLKKTDTLSARMSSVGSKIGTALKVGAAAGGAALVGLAASGIKAFGDFEKSMQEVKTLLPDMGQAEFKAMQDDVIALSKEMGIATDEAIPALYQSISAGVPQENVFDFMRVASKASIGGVTDLETAVDGITTVVNGYGAANMSAEKAADLMFTTVKLGKTNFEELSARLSNVTPIASALGVQFDEVSAAMAVMTAQGVPTGVATTALRSAMAELGKAGSQAATKFEMISGQSFPEFVREGGSLGGALSAMSEHAKANNIELQNMFGSVEAGTAVLALMSEDGAKYADALSAMSDSAGAVDTAFETMDTGVNRAAEKLGVQVEALKIQFGAFLVPIISSVIEKIEPHITTFIGWFSEGGPVRAALSETIEFFVGIWDKIQPTLTNIWDKFTEIVAVVKEWMVDAWTDYGQPTFDTIKEWVTEKLPGWYDTVVTKVKEWAGHAWDSVGKPVFDRVKTFITETLPGYYTAVTDKVSEWAGHAWDTVGAPTLDKVKGVLDNAPGWYGSAIEKAKEWGGAAEPGLKKLTDKETWTKGFSKVSEKFSEVWGKVSVAFDWVGPALTKIGNKIGGLFQPGGGLHSLFEAVSGLMPYMRLLIKFLGAIAGAVMVVIVALQPIITGVITGVIQVLSGVFNILAGVIKVISGVLTGDWKRAWDGVQDMFKGLLEIILAPFTALWDSLQAILDGLIGDLIAKGLELGGKLGQSLIDGVIWLIKEGPGKLIDTLINIGLGVLTMYWKLLNVGKDLGLALIDGIINFIKEAPGKIFDIIVDVALGIHDMATKAIEVGKDLGSSIIDGIVDFIKTAPGKLLDALIGIMPSAGDIISGIGGALSGAVDWIGGDGGVVTKPTFSMIGERGPEAVLPLGGPEARKYLGGGPGTTVNILGDVYSGPDDFADKVVGALRRQDRVHGQLVDLSAP